MNPHLLLDVASDGVVSIRCSFFGSDFVSMHSMHVIRGAAMNFIPAGHEDRKDPGALKKILFKKDELREGRIQMINWAKIPVGKSFQSHHHEDMEEIFILLSGAAEITVGSEIERLQTGDAVVIAEKSDHMMKNIGDIDVEYIVVGITRDQGGKTIVTV